MKVSITVCLSVGTTGCPEAGGHLWAYLNWALGLRALGCEVIWLEQLSASAPTQKMRANVAAVRSRLQPYGLSEHLALSSHTGEPFPREVAEGCLDLTAATEADVLLELRYDTPPEVVRRFRRSALVDIDPGLLQIWMDTGGIRIAPYDVYFTIGETVGQAGARFPDVGLTWHYTPPCVALDWWSPHPAAEDAPFTTVSSWFQNEWVEEEGNWYRNDKLSGFLPFLDLPRCSEQPLELALSLAEDDEAERVALRKRGWRVRDAEVVAFTPWDYQRYIQESRGEFSCAKPSCVRLQNAWVSDRTVCYLASGKPAVVQHTGPSRFLPDAAGLCRFRTLGEAVHCLETVAADYERHCRLARALAEELFDARKVVARVLERALA